MNNITTICPCVEIIDETNTDYIITQVFGWATGILALVKIFFFTITLLIKKYAGNISILFVLVGILGSVCAIVFGVRIDEISVYIRGIIMLILSIIVFVAKFVFDHELKMKKKQCSDTNTEKDPLLMIKNIEKRLKTKSNNYELVRYKNDENLIIINKDEIIINSIKLSYNKDILNSLMEYLKKENLRRDIELVSIK